MEPSRMRTIAFVPVRLTSSRLPKKHLKKIGDRTLISWVIKRLKDSRTIDTVVICAPDEESSKELVSISLQEEVELYLHPGDTNDVVGRLTKAAQNYGADICVLASGDCPLLEPRTIDKLVTHLKKNSDVATVAIGPKESKPPIHEGIVVAKRWVWEQAEKQSNKPEWREHHFPILWMHPPKIPDLQREVIQDEDLFYGLQHRISIDTLADLKFFRAVYEKLEQLDTCFNLTNAMGLLSKNSELLSVNKYVYQKTLTDKRRKIIFFVTAVAEYGYGNLLRAIEISDKLVHQYGFGIEFFVLDEIAYSYIEEMGYAVQKVEGELSLGAGVSIRADVVVFDINKEYRISKTTVRGLQKLDIKVMFIDNILDGAVVADSIVVPTAHYSGAKLLNLKHGVEYIVIRDKVKRVAEQKVIKKDLTLIYSFREETDEEFKKAIAKLENSYSSMIFRNTSEFIGEFLEVLASAKYFISNLGMSAYEAVFLDVEPLIVPISKMEYKDIELFNLFAEKYSGKIFGTGSDIIAREISEFVG